LLIKEIVENVMRVTGGVVSAVDVDVFTWTRTVVLFVTSTLPALSWLNIARCGFPLEVMTTELTYKTKLLESTAYA